MGNSYSINERILHLSSSGQYHPLKVRDAALVCLSPVLSSAVRNPLPSSCSLFLLLPFPFVLQCFATSSIG